MSGYVTTRGKLYGEIWKSSIKKVSDKYGLNYNDLRKLVKENDIPVPSSNYYSKRNRGMPTDDVIVPLPGDPDIEIKLLSHDEVLKEKGIDVDAHNRRLAKIREKNYKKHKMEEEIEQESQKIRETLPELKEKCNKWEHFVEKEKRWGVPHKNHFKSTYDADIQTIEKTLLNYGSIVNRYLGERCTLYIKNRDTEDYDFLEEDSALGCIMISYVYKDILQKDEAFYLKCNEWQTKYRYNVLSAMQKITSEAFNRKRLEEWKLKWANKSI